MTLMLTFVNYYLHHL